MNLWCWIWRKASQLAPRAQVYRFKLREDAVFQRRQPGNGFRFQVVVGACGVAGNGIYYREGVSSAT